MKYLKIVFLLLLTLTLVGCSANVLNSNRETFKNSLEQDAEVMIINGEDAGSYNDYRNNEITFKSTTMPSFFDLRDEDLVTSVKNQGQLGTCWAHAYVAACETNALKTLGLTNEEYIKQNNSEINFSEKAFSYYGLTQSEDANEGFVYLEDGELSIYNSGSNEKGIMCFNANGIELYEESQFPYTNNQGEVDYDGVWTLDEENRYDTTWSINDVNILPSPSTSDENGEYVFDEDALNRIKEEICNGNAVIVSYHADTTLSPLSYEETKERLLNELKDVYHLSDEDADFYIRFRSGLLDIHNFELDKILELIKFRLEINGFDSNLYDVSKYSKDDLAYLLGSEYFGQDADKVIEYEKSLPYYMHQDPNNKIYSHYTYDHIMANHMVTIVGYDDNYSASNFTKGHEPIGNGAFICKNSWSDDWADNGYFYLSYYDQSIQAPTTVSVTYKKNNYKVLTNDAAHFLDVSSSLFENKVLEANIYYLDEDCSVFALGCFTDNYNTNVTMSLYRLKEEYKNPTDGELLSEISKDVTYSGYHRIYLDENIDLHKGDIVSIVITEKVNNSYALLTTYGFNYDYLKGLAEDSINYDLNLLNYPIRYTETIINNNESYISYDGKTWLDWSDEITAIKDGSDILKYISIDNLPSKIYINK